MIGKSEERVKQWIEKRYNQRKKTIPIEFSEISGSQLGLISISGQSLPLQSLLEQCQMLFQPSYFLPLDSGYFPVSVHIPARHKHQKFQSKNSFYLNRDRSIFNDNLS